MQMYRGIAQARSGAALSGATVSVYESDGQTLATIYSGNSTAVTQTNPITADDDGEYTFYAVDGRYTIKVEYPGKTTETISDVIVCDPLERARSVKDYGAACDGTTDDLAAFNLAIASVASGEPVEIIVPATSYLSAATTNGGRYPRFVFKNGAMIASTSGGTATLNTTATRLSWPTRYTIQQENGPDYEYCTNPRASTTDYARYKYINITGNAATLGTDPSVGQRLDYRSWAYGIGAFDIADVKIGLWQRSAGQDGGQLLTQWLVASSPDVGGASERWGTFTAEFNISNRYADSGWSAKRSTLNNWSGILQLVPENDDFQSTPGIVTYNSLFGVVIGPSSAVKSDGLPAQLWNGVLFEPNAVCGNGYGVYASGNDTGTSARDPAAAIALAQTWKVGVDLSPATYATDNTALKLGNSHKITFGTGTYPGYIQANAGGSNGHLSFGIEGYENFRISRGGTSVANYVQVEGGAAGAGVQITAQGSDSNIDTNIDAKGTGKIFLRPNGLTALRLEAVASQDNYWQMYGASSGANGATLKAIGEANTSANILPSGTGAVRLQNSAGTSVVEVNSTGVGFHAATPIARPTITGSRGGNAALANLLTQLASYGLITDGTAA